MKQKRYKKFKKFLIGIVLISGILCSNQQNAQAKDGYICKHGLHTFGDHTINGGVGNYGYTNRYYWIHNAFSSTYEAYIKKAVIMLAGALLSCFLTPYMAIPIYIIWLVLFFREVHFDNHKVFEKYLLK